MSPAVPVPDLDDWLDAYENLWRAGSSPPSLLEFWGQEPRPVDLQLALHELACIDMEHRWRRFFGRVADQQADTSSPALPGLPSWADYHRLIADCCPDSLDGICQEFRVRQCFGDRLDSQQQLARYPHAPAQLAYRLSAIAAELTRAEIHVLVDGRLSFACRMPGWVEVGRRREHEPAAPCLFEEQQTLRLLVADLDDRQLSRTQCRLEVVGKNQILVRHVSNKGSVRCGSGPELRNDAVCTVMVPCILLLRGCSLRISSPVAG